MLSYKKNVTFAYSPEYYIIFDFEENFNKDEWKDWMTNNWHRILYFSVLYLMAVFGGKAVMANRPRYELRYALFFWNACLAVFSLVGTLRTTPEFFHVLYNYGFHHSVCNNSFAFNPITGFWGTLFVLSKLPEFLDTAFIVLRKQKLIFLHYYHHLATAVFLWYGYTDHSSVARWIYCMNFSVHTVMYGYYACRALKYRVPRAISMCITIFQISQMIAGTVVACYVFNATVKGIKCDIHPDLVYLSIFIYLSYFVLFSNFFVQAYLLKSNSVDTVHKQDRSSSTMGTRLFETMATKQANDIFKKVS